MFIFNHITILYDSKVYHVSYHNNKILINNRILKSNNRFKIFKHDLNIYSFLSSQYSVSYARLYLWLDYNTFTDSDVFNELLKQFVLQLFLTKGQLQLVSNLFFIHNNSLFYYWNVFRFDSIYNVDLHTLLKNDYDTHFLQQEYNPTMNILIKDIENTYFNQQSTIVEIYNRLFKIQDSYIPNQIRIYKRQIYNHDVSISKVIHMQIGKLINGEFIWSNKIQKRMVCFINSNQKPSHVFSLDEEHGIIEDEQIPYTSFYIPQSCIDKIVFKHWYEYEYCYMSFNDMRDQYCCRFVLINDEVMKYPVRLSPIEIASTLQTLATTLYEQYEGIEDITLERFKADIDYHFIKHNSRQLPVYPNLEGLDTVLNILSHKDIQQLYTLVKKKVLDTSPPPITTSVKKKVLDTSPPQTTTSVKKKIVKKKVLDTSPPQTTTSVKKKIVKKKLIKKNPIMDSTQCQYNDCTNSCFNTQYCYAHQNICSSSTTSKQTRDYCLYVDVNGVRCRKKPNKGYTYCSIHRKLISSNNSSNPSYTVYKNKDKKVWLIKGTKYIVKSHKNKRVYGYIDEQGNIQNSLTPDMINECKKLNYLLAVSV